MIYKKFVLGRFQTDSAEIRQASGIFDTTESETNFTLLLSNSVYMLVSSTKQLKTKTLEDVCD